MTWSVTLAPRGQNHAISEKMGPRTFFK